MKTLAGLVLAVLVLTMAAPAMAQSDKALERIEANALNRPLGSLKDAAEQARGKGRKVGPPREVVNFRGETTGPAGSGLSVPDAVVQTAPGDGLTTTFSGFYGASNNDNGSILGFMIAPPDTDGAVGPNHYVQMINCLTTIYDKNGNEVQGPFASNAIWAGIGGNCEPYNQGDPIIVYDDIQGRWLVSQFAFPDNMATFSQCVAVSQDGDPTGGWNRYEFPFDGYGFNDYPKHGIVSDSITMMANLFTKRGRNFTYGGTFLGVMDKDAMYVGAPASLIGFNIGSGEFGFVAGDLDGPGTAPALFATAMSTASAFDIWEVDVDWSTEDATVSQIVSIPVTAFDSDLCSASREACIPQPDGGPALEAIADRLMHRLQIRDFTDYRTMVTSHTVDAGGGRAGIRWYELRESGGTWSLFQEGTFAPNDGEHRFMPSAAMNASGDIGIGYLLASTNTYVSTAVTGQSAAASGSGLLDSDEIICAAGSGIQTDTGRSGDYSATSVDESNGSFWHTNEVFVQSGQFQWATYVCEFNVGSGSGNIPPTASFTYTCTDLACDFTDTSSDDDAVNGWSWSFGDGATSTDQNPTHSYHAGGTYTVGLTVTDSGGATDSASTDVTVDDGLNDPPSASFTFTCNELACDFTDTSSDSDGTVVAWDWIFGDGATSTAQNPSHTYAAGGTYTVSLTVIDDGGAADTASTDVTVTEPSTGIALTAVGYKYRGRHAIDLSWSGAEGSNVDVYRDGGLLTTTANDGSYTDATNNKGERTYIYKVCEAGGTDTCSNEVTVVFL